MDPASKEGLLLKKKAHQDKPDFWFTRFYRTNIDGNFIKASCSFWGPFLDCNQNKACCFFFTSIKNYKNNTSVNKNLLTTAYPSYTIFYYELCISGNSYYKPCYIGYTPFKNILLLGYKNKYFTLFLAAFFPVRCTNKKRIFLTYHYTIEQLQALKSYFNTIRKSDKKTINPYIPNPYFFNNNLHDLLVYFLHTTKNLPVNRVFYKEVNRNINFLIKQLAPTL